MKRPERINCKQCKFYFVTWDVKHPHGCRAMGFKGKEIPSITVYKNSGSNCLLFKPKKPKPNNS